MIRFATIADCEAFGPLVLVILKDMELPFLQEVEEEQVLQLLTEASKHPDYRYGYQRALVKEIDGEIAGVAFGYPSEDEKVIDRPFAEVLKQFNLPAQKIFTDPETFPDEWYLDTLSVAEAYRGKGIGSELLEALPQIAQRDGKQRIGLCCDFANPKAQRLYERKGFKIVGEQMIGRHHYHHMQKML